MSLVSGTQNKDPLGELALRYPRLLLFGVQVNNTGSCRMPKILKAAGFQVGVVAEKSSYLHAPTAIDRHFYFRSRRFAPGILWGLEDAQRVFGPDVIVPSDERAASLIRYWVAKERQGQIVFTSALRDTLERSLGSLESLDRRSFKTESRHLAESIGLRVPREVVAASVDQAAAAADMLGYPVVVKAAHGVGGIVGRRRDDREAVKEYFLHLHRSMTSKIKRVRRRLQHRDWFPGVPDIVVQEYVPGQPAMTCAAALSGRTLGVITAFTERTRYKVGPSTVVRLSEHAGMVAATTAMVSALGASGFISFDFIVDAEGREQFIECNPRPIQIFHLGPMVGVDLAKSFKDALVGDVPSTPQTVNGQVATVALFPQEWRREPTSLALTEVYHDVPWDDPPLLHAIINRRMRFWRGGPADEEG